MPPPTLHIGQVLRFRANPFTDPIDQAVDFNSHGAVLVEDGMIKDIGSAMELRTKYPELALVDHGENLISAGFVDAHAHYPQTAMIASWGKRLIDWLNLYTFPEELRFADPDYATEIAGRYLDLILAHGTTCVASYCTSHPVSVDAFFEAAKTRGMRVVAGKTCMDRNAPEGLLDTATRAYDESAALLARWHGVDRLCYAITPRFSPTSTPAQLDALGTLWSEHPDCPMQTHLSEQIDEIAWVRQLFPDARDYLDTYEAHGLLRPGAMFGHVIHLEARERDRLLETGAGVVHCPTSNTFIGSGLFATDALARGGHLVGLANDTGGGSSFSMLRTMAAAYEIGQLKGTALHPAHLWWLATVGSAQVLRAEDKIGNLAPGMEADLVIIDLASTLAISQRSRRAENIWDALFPTIMMGDDRAIAATYVAGNRR
ncbi:MAG: guanine deaminase [Pseudomonadota bacterium]